MSHGRILLRFSIESMIRGYHEYKAVWDDPEDHLDLATMRSAYNIIFNIDIITECQRLQNLSSDHTIELL